MKRRVEYIVAAIILLFSLFSVLPSSAGDNVYTENFSTTLYEDPAYTTANWNTVNGELSLFQFQLTLTGNYDTPGNAYAVTVAGNYAFVADNTAGLHVFSILDPANPGLLGTCDTPGRAYDVKVSGDYAFVADYANGLKIIDVSTKSNPIIVGN